MHDPPFPTNLFMRTTNSSSRHCECCAEETKEWRPSSSLVALVSRSTKAPERETFEFSEAIPRQQALDVTATAKTTDYFLSTRSY